MIIRLEIKSYNMMLTRKHQKYCHYHLKIDKYEYLIGEDILPPNQIHIIEQANFSYSSLGKAFEKKRKKIVLCYKEPRSFQ